MREGGGVERREARLNQPVVPAPRPTCQHACDSCFLFHSLSPSLSAFTPPSLPAPLNLSSPIYLPASHQPLPPTTPSTSIPSLQLAFALCKTNNSYLCAWPRPHTNNLPTPQFPPSSSRHRKLLGADSAVTPGEIIYLGKL